MQRCAGVVLGRAAAGAGAFRRPPRDSRGRALVCRPFSSMAQEGDAPSPDALRGMSCVGMCSKDTPKVSREQIDKHLEQLPLWKLDESGKTISRQFTARNFMAAMRFLNEVGELAERETHHPDFHLTSYREVRVDLSTHAVGGLTLPDLIMASKIDGVKVDYSPKWLEKNPAAAGTALAAPPKAA